MCCSYQVELSEAKFTFCRGRPSPFPPSLPPSPASPQTHFLLVCFFYDGFRGFCPNWEDATPRRVPSRARAPVRTRVAASIAAEALRHFRSGSAQARTTLRRERAVREAKKGGWGSYKRGTGGLRENPPEEKRRSSPFSTPFSASGGIDRR